MNANASLSAAPLDDHARLLHNPGLTMRWLLCGLVFTAISCASTPKNIQPQINSLVAAQRLPQAQSLLGNDPSVYGARNQLLFWLDKGMVSHLLGNTQDSIMAFERANHLFEELYTKSLSQIASSWIINDARKDYRGDEQEYVLVNVFQALNYAMDGDLDEALVEARRMDDKFKILGGRYQNPFSHLLSGLLRQQTMEPNAASDALIDYQRALKFYAQPPAVLEDLMAQAQGKKPDWRKQGKARVLVIDYTGFVPVKVPSTVSVPLGPVDVTQFSVPYYLSRPSVIALTQVKVLASGVVVAGKNTEIVCDIGALAMSILDGQKASLRLKAGLRPVLKYAAVKAAQVPAQKEGGDLAAGLVGLAGSFYSMATEQADIRSWQTLPQMIRLAILDVEPGEYDIVLDDWDAAGNQIQERPVKKISLKAGEWRVLTSRAWK